MKVNFMSEILYGRSFVFSVNGASSLVDSNDKFVSIV